MVAVSPLEVRPGEKHSVEEAAQDQAELVEVWALAVGPVQSPYTVVELES